MSTRKITVFYAFLIAVASLAVGMVVASRLDLAPVSTAATLPLPTMNSAPLAGPLSAETFRNIAAAATPMVVNIRTESKAKGQDLSDFFGGSGSGGGGDDLFHRFFDQPGGARPRERVAVATGTGFIVSKDGHILTNNHVVEGATKITVGLYGDDDQTYDAKIVGRDSLTDSALIVLTEKPDRDLPVAKFGDSAEMAPGDWVMAIGNPFGYADSVSVGVISATKRPFETADQRYQDVLQTDAAINPGNSGGPLLNLRGEVIGINTAIISNDRTSGNLGIGFAVPINTVRDLLPQLETGRVIRGKIGVQVMAVSHDAVQALGLKKQQGALVSTVTPGGAAAKGGIKPGDVILDFNGRPVQNRDALVAVVIATKPGTTVPVKVVRDGREQTLSVTVDELDLEAEATQTPPQPPNDAGETSGGFGITLNNLTPDISRRLRLPQNVTGAIVTDVDPNGPSGGLLTQFDVMTEVNHKAVTSAAEASRELRQIPSGNVALLLIWRNGQQVFLTVKKQ
ncbi:MAG TPA: trypsin-like peptidase domain-containing protein [Vicinamibacterales bacterium]|nr:trypsin-like peptidase domain-containing protein [Vicinamibacterales bacterium]